MMGIAPTLAPALGKLESVSCHDVKVLPAAMSFSGSTKEKEKNHS